MELSDDISEGSLIGRHIGVYRLDEEVGRGGMGAVYRATRIDGEFHQTVAVKLIKRGMDTDLILKRFRRERQILAALNHPNIASFLGGGSTEDGLPYFVMEYINGKPLYSFCDENRLTTSERLKIFREICYAVIAAHRTQIIHRDLKPSNILVRADRKPKLLDFGIAKVLDPDLMVTDIEPTATQMRVMTPEYASPEQISGGSIGEASDIYSLGVILYELLTGHRPYSLRRGVPDETARVIREEEPTNPSGSLTLDNTLIPAGGESSLEAILASRRSSLEGLRRDLFGDLDKITLKTLRKDPNERYSTAADLANDITNHLDGRPVNAKFFVSMSNLPRPRASDTISAAILPLKMIGDIHSEDTGDEFLGIGLADALISRLSGVQRLLVRPTSSVLAFKDTDAIETGRMLKVDFVLDGNVRRAGSRIRVSVQLLSIADGSARWAKAFDEDLTDVLELEDKIAEQVAALLLPQITVEERRHLAKRGTNKPEAYQAYLRGRYFVNRFTDEHLLKAVDAFNEAIRIDPNYALPYIGLADFYMWSAIFGEITSDEGFGQAQTAIRRALEIDDSIGEAYAVLAFCVLLSDWNWQGAEELVTRGIELSPNYYFAHECLSNFYCAQGRFDEALIEIEHAEELDPFSPRAKVLTAWTYYHVRRHGDSAEAARTAIRMQENFPQGLLHLGNALTELGELDDAIKALRESLKFWPTSGMTKYMLCHALAANAQTDESRAILDELLAVPNIKPYFVAMCYVALKEYDNAFEWFQKAVDAHNEWLAWFAVDPKLDPIRSDKRYFEILKAIRNPILERESGGYSNQPDTGDREKSIAVLPFKLIGIHDSSTAGEEFLSIGLADALTMRLSNVGRFLVRPTSSVLSFTGNETDPILAGGQLGVEYVLDGSIRHIRGRIRVTVQLLDVAANGTRWAASFDEKYTDVLELEDLISERVTRSLLPQLTGDEQIKLSKRGTDNAEAHEAYLQGRFFWNQFTPDSFAKSIASFRKAVELDTNYGLAHVGIADFYTWACIYGIIPPFEGTPKVFEAASRALEIDDKLPEAHAAIGLYYSNIQRWADSEKSYRRAIELNPNYPLGHEWLSAVTVGTGRFEEGTREILLAEDLDPVSVRPKVLSAWTLYQTRNYPLAVQKAREIISLDPNLMQGYLQLGNILTVAGDVGEALAACRRSVELGAGTSLPLYGYSFALAAAGEKAEATKLAVEMREKASSIYIPPYFVGLSLLAAGKIDDAFEWLEKAQTENSAWMLWFGTEPKLDPIRNDPRYWKLLEASTNPIIDILRNKKKNGD